MTGDGLWQVNPTLLPTSAYSTKSYLMTLGASLTQRSSLESSAGLTCRAQWLCPGREFLCVYLQVNSHSYGKSLIKAKSTINGVMFNFFNSKLFN
jgi:hypothetical protein